MRDPGIRRAVETALGSAVTDSRALGGGDINEAYAVTLADGRKAFVKHARGGPDPRMFPAEARGLAWLAEAGTLRIPEVLAVDASLLILELLQPATRAPDFEEQLGRGLARLHRAGAPAGFGFDEDNFIGSLEQLNEPCESWSEFWVTRRLQPQVGLAVDTGRLGSASARGFERLYSIIDELAGPSEPAARLHGDLWSGNVHVGPAGEPCLIDPAVYGGHREVDLAMLQLFGGPGERFFAAYDEEWPRSPGHRDRVALWQLYPLLVHVNLFGGAYVRSVQEVLARYV